MRVNLRRPHIAMPQQRLQRADIRAPLQQMRRKAVSQDVRRHFFRNPRPLRRSFYGDLPRRFVDVMPPLQPRRRVSQKILRREKPA